MTKKQKRPIVIKPIPPTPEKTAPNVIRTILPIIIVIIITAVPFLMGKYIEFNTPDAFDSGSNVYSAKHIIDGAQIGTEEKPSAKIATLFFNIVGVWLFGFNEIGPKLMQTILQIAALIAMFIAMRKLFSFLPAAISIIIASTYLSSPLIAKWGNVKEQYMIAFMVIGISFFILYQLRSKWFYAIASAAFLAWGPLFKETGTSAIAAVGIFVIAQPLLKHKTIKQTITDILLLITGGVIGLIPICLFAYILKAPFDYWPYTSIINIIISQLPTAAAIAQSAVSRESYLAIVPFSEQWPRVLRYYAILILPIALAIASIITRLTKLILQPRKNTTKTYDRFVLLLAAWWILDMAFVWISSRSYEQYYLPLNASGAMLAAYCIAVYLDNLKTTKHKTAWKFAAVPAVICMIIFSWHVFFGISKSPHSGAKYSSKRKGYSQRIEEISNQRKNDLTYPWQRVGDYIRLNSQPTDKIYVWGWYPGVYVRAQRFSSATKAFCMPRPAPEKLAETVNRTIEEFKKEMPKFIVDSRKRHIPTNRPAYELWPIVQLRRNQSPQFLPKNQDVIDGYIEGWSQQLAKAFDNAEAERFLLLENFRKFIRENYEIVEPSLFQPVKMYGIPTLSHKRFGQLVVFQLKQDS